MESFIIYIAKASVLIAIFILAYNRFLKKETFFTTNRWYLLAGLFTSVALPLLVYTKVIWIDPLPAADYKQIDLRRLVTLQQQAHTVSDTGFVVNWFDIVAGIYIAGVLFFLARFVVDIVSLRKVINGKPIIKQDNYLLIDSPAVQSPFSFFNYIFYNSAVLEPDELESIISHEKVHSRQKHSLDMITGQLFCAAFWFNPFVWMYKKSISQNLEFIADAEAIKLIADKQAYQKTLLKITVQPQCIAITNHFYQSLIKKRIVMLNKPKSKRRNSWKYAIVLPVVAVFMLLFQVKTVAQEKNSPARVTSTKTKVAVEVNKDSKDEELEADKKLLKEEFNTDVNFQNITRNQSNEITGIKVTVKDQGQSQVYEVSGQNPISPFTVEVEKNDKGRNSISFGTGGNNYAVTARAFHIFDGEGMDDDAGDTLRKGHHRIIRSYADVRPPAGRHMDPPAPMRGNSPQVYINRAKIGDGDMLVVVDGVKQKKGEGAVRLPMGREIDQINVLEGKEAKKKYGKEAKKGVVEITTKAGGGARFMQMTPEGFEFEFPDMREGMNFQFEFPDIENMEGLEGMEQFKNFRFEDFDNLGEMFSPEDMARMQADINRAQAELQRMMPEINGRLRGSLSDDEYNNAKKEIEEAKKEIEKAKKEIEEARKEIAKSRKELNRKA